MTSFSVAPLRCVSVLGIFAAVVGGAFGLWIGLKALFLGDPVQGYPSLVSIITFLGGIQLFALGIVGEYVGKTYIEAKQRPNYLIRDIIEAPVATNRSALVSLGEERHVQTR